MGEVHTTASVESCLHHVAAIIRQAVIHVSEEIDIRGHRLGVLKHQMRCREGCQAIVVPGTDHSMAEQEIHLPVEMTTTTMMAIMIAHITVLTVIRTVLTRKADVVTVATLVRIQVITSAMAPLIAGINNDG